MLDSSSSSQLASVADMVCKKKEGSLESSPWGAGSTCTPRLCCAQLTVATGERNIEDRFH
jgi:hypothetical protein